MKIIRFEDVSQTAASHEDPNDPGTLKKVLLAAKDEIRGHIQMINWATVFPGKSFYPHAHKDMYEIFIMLDTGAAMNVNGKDVPLARGDELVVEPGELHELRNTIREPVEYIVIGIA